MRCSSRPAPRRRPEERRLRYAACLISDIGWREHPDYRGEQSLNLLAHAGLSGIDHQGRVFMALAVFYRHAGASQEHAEELSERLKALVSKRAQKRARIVAAAVRTAHMLSIGVAGVIDETPLSYDGDKLVLTIPKAYAGSRRRAVAPPLRIAGHAGREGAGNPHRPVSNHCLRPAAAIFLAKLRCS